MCLDNPSRNLPALIEGERIRCFGWFEVGLEFCDVSIYVYSTSYPEFNVCVMGSMLTYLLEWSDNPSPCTENWLWDICLLRKFLRHRWCLDILLCSGDEREEFGRDGRNFWGQQFDRGTREAGEDREGVVY